jgi:hypothetical protein
MKDDLLPKHAILIRWRTFQAGIFGWPAVVSVSAAGVLLLLAHMLNLMNYLPHLP